jgi:lysozyme
MTTERPALNQAGRIDGIDVSAIQGRVDWERVASAGFRWAAAKASEGVSYCDPRVEANIAGASAAGLRTLVYAFARPSQGNPREQAKRLAECTHGAAMRTVLDLESSPADWTPQRIVDFGDAFADGLQAESGLLPVVYSYVAFLLPLGRALMNSRLARCPVWLAQYRSTSAPWAPVAVQQPVVPMPWGNWTMWQYSGNGGYRVPGVAVDCDRNLFRGDEDAFRAFFVGDVPTLPELPAADSEPPVVIEGGTVHVGSYGDGNE